MRCTAATKSSTRRVLPRFLFSIIFNSKYELALEFETPLALDNPNSTLSQVFLILPSRVSFVRRTMHLLSKYGIIYSLCLNR